MDADHYQPLILVLAPRRGHTEVASSQLMRSVGPEIDEDDFSAQSLRRQGWKFSHSFARSSRARTGYRSRPRKSVKERNPRRCGCHWLRRFRFRHRSGNRRPRTVASTTAAKSLLVFIGKCLLQTERRGPISRRLSNRGSQRQLPAGLLRDHVLGYQSGQFSSR